MCLTVAEDAAIYLDGRLALETRKERPTNKTVMGTLILGQDQDKPNGGYDKEASFSGMIVDFHFFSRVLSSEEVLAMAGCREPPSDSFVSLGSNWVLRNVSVSSIARKEMCKEKARFFLFTMSIFLPDILKECRKVNGYVPGVEEKKAIKQDLRMQLERFHAYIKLFILINCTQTKDSQLSCLTLRIIWDDGDYINTDVKLIKKYTYFPHFMCGVKDGATLKLLGLPKKIQRTTDSVYTLNMQEGKLILRGVRRSFILYENRKWCLYLINTTNHVACTNTPSNFPPMGRKLWSFTNETITITLSGCKEDQFTCDTGHCISLNSRCDTLKNCKDGSDEDNCNVIRIENTQRRSVTGVPFKPLQVEAIVDLISVPKIHLSDNNFVSALWLRLSWTDERLQFFNLLPDSRKLSLNNMWRPEVVLSPVNGDSKARLESAKVRRVCDGEPVVYSMGEGE